MGSHDVADSLSPRDFERLSKLIHSECGIYLVPEKRTMLEVRIRKRVRSLNLASCSEYAAYVLSPAGQEREIVHLIDVVTTNKTDFFRESRHFEFLLDTALPALVETRGAGSNQPFLVWSAGCSTGEEPYTLAMVLSEYAERSPGFRFRIMATDVSTQVLERARQAVFTPEAVEPIPAGLVRKYLMRSRGPEPRLYRVVPELRAAVEFRRLNFMDGDFRIAGLLDVIFCRNVIIYFDRATRESLLTRFSRQLRPGGYLFLGHSETLNGMDLTLLPAGPTVYRRPYDPRRQ